ncbi:hypothetical protein VUJ46_14085 [Chryseobacterium sp. MYb264]|uniref:hypothetical protein n=1 Tax=Chryseobacterium sp. MYb264 TaxID=2745153 RepID=UPI002E1588A6|nr:hypothetical protein VUJ46_14085 [Chryseobacterium sp. MYb264]
MHSLAKKIQLVKQAFPTKTSFCNGETSPSAVTSFECCECGHQNPLKITPYESGYPIGLLYHKDQVISKEELLRHKLVTKTAKNFLHFGEFTVNNLPTLYFGISCTFCRTGYICIFSYGEKQPGLTLLTISGIWEYL